MAAGEQTARDATPWKQPPLVKVYEAFSAVAAGRVDIVEPGRARVTSSNGSRVYDVWWDEEARAFFSSDSGSKWQGYTGYPIVAVLLVLGRLHAEPAHLAPLAGVDWHELNERFRRKYDEVVAHVLAEVQAAGADAAAVSAAAEEVAAQLARLNLVRLTGRRRAAPRDPSGAAETERAGT